MSMHCNYIEKKFIIMNSSGNANLRLMAKTYPKYSNHNNVLQLNNYIERKGN